MIMNYEEQRKRQIRRAKAKCALTVRHLMKDKRSIDACDAALKYSNGEITREELNTDAAYAYADAAYAYAAAAYAYAAAADAAYAYAAAAAYAAARIKNRKQTAEICREILTEEVYKKITQ